MGKQRKRKMRGRIRPLRFHIALLVQSRLPTKKQVFRRLRATRTKAQPCIGEGVAQEPVDYCNTKHDGGRLYREPSVTVLLHCVIRVPTINAKDSIKLVL